MEATVLYLSQPHVYLHFTFQQVVLDENKFPDRTLEIQVKRIDVECKKNSSLIDNDKKMFKRTRYVCYRLGMFAID